ncbi:MAG: hypothetical protein ABIG66_04245 [Candidatus Kerfeldbacteria bacterium]
MFHMAIDQHSKQQVQQMQSIYERALQQLQAIRESRKQWSVWFADHVNKRKIEKIKKELQ